MPSLKLSNPFRRNADRPSLKERAVALKATAARVMKSKQVPRTTAERLREMMPYHEGFAPYPTEAPMSLMAIEDYIPLEAKRLLDLACGEYGRLYPCQSAGKDEAGRQAVSDRLRREYRIDELRALAEPASTEDGPTTPDPIFDVLAASRAAEAAVRAFGEETTGAAMGESGFVEEARLVAEQTRAFDASLAAIPTTLAGARALVDYFRWQASLRGYRDWEHPKNDEWFFGPMLKALANAIEALPAEPAPSAIDLSACTLQQLARLCEVLESCWQSVGAHTQAPFCWGDDRRSYSAIGDILTAEEDRLDDLLSAIKSEAARRAPANEDERDHRLMVLIRHGMLGGSIVEDRALLSEAFAAWGGAARG